MIGRALFGPVLRLRTQEGDPDVGDDARPLLVQQHVGLAGGNAEVVPVALLIQVAARLSLGIELLLAAAPDLTDAHGGGGAHGAALLRFGEIIQETGLHRRQHSRAEQQQDYSFHIRLGDGNGVALTSRR